MSVTVRIPTILRTYTGGASELTVSPPEDTLAAAIEALEVAAPGIRARVLDDTGALRRFVNIYVDDDDVTAHDSGEDDDLTAEEAALHYVDPENDPIPE
jgi:molybdopterin converting factor small subunit